LEKKEHYVSIHLKKREGEHDRKRNNQSRDINTDARDNQAIIFFSGRNNQWEKKSMKEKAKEQHKTIGAARHEQGGM